jgi:hypothetical protein
MSLDCKILTHPFQTDPGTSQRQRLLDDLLSGSAKIDARPLADLLDFFVQLSRHVNYYDEKLLVSDWQPFFSKSLPFVLASIIKYDRGATEKKLAAYKTRFDGKPTAAGLQLLLSYVFNNIIKKVNHWQQQVSGSSLPLETAMDKLIRDKLTSPVKEFMRYANAGTKWYCTKNYSFNVLLENPVWGLKNTDITEIDDSFKTGANTKRKRLIALYNKAYKLVQSFFDVIRVLGVSAEMSLDQSLLPLKEELKEKHPPHLAILFAFLKLFQQLQGDLNSFTKKHLDYFYKEVLKLKPKEAEPDKLHVVFEIQQQLDSYLLKKGILLKDGKDNNKAEIYFATDDEIVVNKTQVADQRTLFLNNQDVDSITYVEGVYMAPDATKADGVDKDFKAVAVPSRAALGAKWSKYEDPENKFFHPYPNARIGFVLASPVLLLNEGKREITITLDCTLNKDYCKSLVPEVGVNNPCCDDHASSANGRTPLPDSRCFSPEDASQLYNLVGDALGKTYYYINRALIAEAVKKGIDKTTQQNLESLLTITHTKNDPGSEICYCPVDEKIYETTILATTFEQDFAGSFNILKEIFKPRKAFKLLLSGEKEWLAPLDEPVITIIPAVVPGPPIVLPNLFNFTLKLTATLKPEEAAVTFYNGETLKEDLNTTLPVAKIELDDKIKIPVNLANVRSTLCCEKPFDKLNQDVSLYHFFRNVTLRTTTKIDVRVCGVKQLIVQNDESVQDVNAPIFAFGTRPKVGASFYIGSKELFSKNWQNVFVNAEWKDKPKDFGVHYQHYSYKDTIFEDGSKEIVHSSFLTTASILDKGVWQANGQRRLFKPVAGEVARTKPLPVGFPPVPVKPEIPALFCNHGALSNNQDVYDYVTGVFAGLSAYERRPDLLSPLIPYNVTSQYGFLRLTLEGVSFQQDIFPFVLTRQMMAYAGLLPLDIIQQMVTKANDAKKIIDAMNVKIGNINTHIGHIQGDVGIIAGNITAISTELVSIQANLVTALANIPLVGATNIPVARNQIGSAQGHITTINNLLGLGGLTGNNNAIQGELDLIVPDLANTGGGFNPNNANAFGLIRLGIELNAIIVFFVSKLQVDPALKDGLPSEPYTPVIKSLSLDYTATANDKDIDLIHLYPYAGTYKLESIPQRPTLLPTFCDEGNLFIGLKDLVPGSNVNILFQLAEATADSETEREKLKWFYLENNTWKLLRTGFEVLDDDTNALTTSGIIKFMLPANMTNENTILPKGLHWIKASIPCHSKSVSEIISIHTQAMKATFTNDAANDKLRLVAPLAAGSVAKLKVADASIKKINQPYDSFDGREPEVEKHFYIRTSELLRHKNRAIQKFDYERLVLEAFPKIFKVKCINHSYALNANKFINDFPMAPGYVLIAVIPDLNQLKAAQSFEPRVPVSMLEDIKTSLQKVTSPFVRLWIKNPRYEKVNFCLRVKLLPGKDEVYYKSKMEQDLREFLAPWFVGEYDKLAFGQPINRSDVIRFLESKDYLDYIIDLKMVHADDDISTSAADDKIQEILPITPRSILIAGTVDVCINQADCETWCECKDATGQQDADCCEHKVIKVNNYCNEQQPNNN